MKCSLSIARVGGLAPLFLLALGCGVDSKGLLVSQRDAADSARTTFDVRPADSHEGGAPTLDAQLFDSGGGDAADVRTDLAAFVDVANPNPDLRFADSPSVADVLSAIEVKAAPDASPPDAAVDRGPSPKVDAPAIVSMDAPVPEAAPSTDAATDSARADLAPPDLPVSLDIRPLDVASLELALDVFPDLGRDVSADVRYDVSRDLGRDVGRDLGRDVAPDLGHDVSADLGPSPTVGWVIDNTSSIGGYTPTVLGAPTVTALDAGVSVCFDGKKDGLSFATNPIQGMAAFTIETLVYPELASATAARLIHIGNPASPNRRLVIQMVSDASGNWHVLAAFGWNAVPTNIEDTKDSHPSGRWYWLALTYDGQTARVYVDGVLENSGDLTFGPMAAGSISLATRQNGQFFFPGCMRDVDFFDSALSASQLRKP